MKVGLSILLLSFLFISSEICAQNAKQHLKAGEQFFQNGMVDAALEEYKRALSLDPDDGKTYSAMASVFLYKNDTLQSANNFQKAAALNFNTEVNALKAAKLYYSLNDSTAALECIDIGLASKPKDINLLLFKVRILFEQENFPQTYQLAQEAIKVKDLAQLYYYFGASAFKLGLYEEADKNLEKAIIRDSKLADAYLTVAEMQIEQKKFDYAIDNCTMVLLLMDPDNVQALLLRSRAFKLTNEPEDAIADLTKALGNSNNTIDIIAERAQVNLDYAMYADAIHDYNIVLNKRPDDAVSLENRAFAHEQIGNYPEALNDYKNLSALLNTQNADPEKMGSIENKVFELGRENTKPVLTLKAPLVNEDLELIIKEGSTEVIIAGNIHESSELKELKINNQAVPFEVTNENKYAFSYSLDALDLDFVSITAIDLYGNISTESYTISYIETVPPRVDLISPIAGSAGVIQLETNDNTLYIEGRILDKSNIVSIKVDEVNASFTPGDYNPKFTATINVQNRNNITITATDAFGNETQKTYEFAKDGYLLSDNNPMGKTWVVIIENTQYQEYTNLTGPAKDVKLLSEALGRYQISNVLHKKDMTKRELERFFAIDLRDLIVSNQVNSLMIWYAGHGQSVNNVGYWIPVDGRQNDEYSFFNINALKASLYSYQTLTHTLVVSDACHAGESFTIAMRGSNNGLATCNDVDLIANKSALVLTSSYQEVALDNSLFTRTFANALANNPADCIPIDAIAERISIVMYKNTAQKPVFGRITGLEDKNGTFFFVSK